MLSGATDVEKWPAEQPLGVPMNWIWRGVRAGPRRRSGRRRPGRRVHPRQRRRAARRAGALRRGDRRRRGRGADRGRCAHSNASKLRPALPVGRLSYSGLARYRACGYRFYLERVVGLHELAATPEGAQRRSARSGRARAAPARDRGARAARAARFLGARARRRPRTWRPGSSPIGADSGPGAVEDVRRFVTAFLDALAASSASLRANRVRQELGFAYEIAPPETGGRSLLVNGFVDVYAEEPDANADRGLQDGLPRGHGCRRAGARRATRSSASSTRWRPCARALPRVEVAYCFLERPDATVTREWTAADSRDARTRAARARGRRDRRAVRTGARAAPAPLRAVRRPARACARGMRRRPRGSSTLRSTRERRAGPAAAAGSREGWDRRVPGAVRRRPLRARVPRPAARDDARVHRRRGGERKDRRQWRERLLRAARRRGRHALRDVAERVRALRHPAGGPEGRRAGGRRRRARLLHGRGERLAELLVPRRRPSARRRRRPAGEARPSAARARIGGAVRAAEAASAAAPAPLDRGRDGRGQRRTARFPRGARTALLARPDRLGIRARAGQARRARDPNCDRRPRGHGRGRRDRRDSRRRVDRRSLGFLRRGALPHRRAAVGAGDQRRRARRRSHADRRRRGGLLLDAHARRRGRGRG